MTTCIMVPPVWKTSDSLPVIYTISVRKASYFAEENVLEAPSPLSLPLVSKYVLVCIHAVPLRDSVVSSSWLLFTNKGVSSKGALPTADAS